MVFPLMALEPKQPWEAWGVALLSVICALLRKSRGSMVVPKALTSN